MSPIERICARSQDLSVLGLTGTPTKSEIKRAFRKLALEKHPDHSDTSHEEFVVISDAYRRALEAVCDDGSAEGSASPSVKRPSVRTTDTVFPEQARSACKWAMADMGAAGTRHVATRLQRKGRVLTYFVPDQPENGLNSVGVPTGDLVDNRRLESTVLQIWSGDVKAGTYFVPAQKCAVLFPGARSVQIRFGEVTKH